MCKKLTQILALTAFFSFIINVTYAESDVRPFVNGQENVKVLFTKESLEDIQDFQMLPFAGVVEIASKEEKIFQFFKYKITIVNDTDSSMKLLLFIDEGVPICAIIKPLEGYGSWSIHHELPNNSNAVIIIDDNWE